MSGTKIAPASERTAAAEGPAGTRGTKIAVVLCIVTILLAVLDSNIVSSATVPIVRDLDPVHGVDRIPWLIAAYQLAATAALPLYGKLCDSLGAKKIFIGALATFLAGSALCGMAQSMGELIAARAFQGIGGGGLMSVTMVVLRQLGAAGPKDGEDTKAKDGGSAKTKYGEGAKAKDGQGAKAKGGEGAKTKGGDKKGNIGGIIAGAGMALGPWLGGALSDHAGWRWIFYVNLPVGIAVLIAAAVVVKLPAHTTRHRIDFLGAGLAAAFSTALLLVTEWGGEDYAWTSPTIVGLAAAAAVALGLFLWRQATAAEPILPLSLFGIRTMRYGFAIQGLVGVAMMGSIVYVMIYLQVVRGIAATSAGLFLVPMAIGMTVVGLVSGRLVAAGWSQKTFVVSGTVSASTALALLTTLDTDTGLWTLRGAMLLMGIGFGQLIGQLIELVQDTAPPSRLGVATTGVRFFQTLGTALGASLFGAVLSRVYAAKGPGGSTSDIARLTGTARAHALDAFVSSADVVFACATGTMVLALILATRLPGTRTKA
ncbi:MULTISPECIES: MFS transporter [unclassified Streptomyces]|uniref:MFS transporter n=1 Tax=unclassified Streptomyces TaxID=2593676 RepID=UPI002ED3ED18|nr:MFS transporter [Streptomyces sp. NBC_00891]WSY06709.1 MFS transporter [Streptomyces sp. NBC_00890]WSZ08333.1 MFS transporter [Streptomyces sp. NBC_00869]WSZ24168.1 MFS transporter [Streptomyces sp. NBC_00870]